MFRILVLTAGALALGACASTYVEPDKDDQFATLIMEKGYKDGYKFFKNYTQEYSVVTDDKCLKLERAAQFSFATGQDKELRLRPDEPIKLVASITLNTVSTDYYQGAVQFGGGPCTSKLEFTPEAGRTYYAKHTQPEDGPCTLEFYEETNGKMPEEAVIENNYVCGPW